MGNCPNPVQGTGCAAGHTFPLAAVVMNNGAGIANRKYIGRGTPQIAFSPPETLGESCSVQPGGLGMSSDVVVGTVLFMQLTVEAHKTSVNSMPNSFLNIAFPLH